MNHWTDEFMAEYHRQEILQEVDHIRLEGIAVKARLYRPGLFERTMFNFANWMIATGKHLRKRYEIPTVECNPTATEGFAS